MSSFKIALKNAQVAKSAREREQALRNYKKLYYGLTSFLRPLWELTYKEQEHVRESIRKGGRFWIAPGERLPDGSYTFPEINWEAFNEARELAWEEFLISEGILPPLEVMSMRDITTARENLIRFCLENFDVLEPLKERVKKPSDGSIGEALKEINQENLKAMGRYQQTQEPEVFSEPDPF